MLAGILLVSVIVFSAFTPAFASDGVGDIETDMPKVVGIEFPLWEVKEIDRNWYYFSLFQDLIGCFPTVLVEGNYGLVEEIVYPSEYAGAYIDEDDNLHILLTKDADMETEFAYRAILGYDEDVVFEVAKYSFSFLKDIQRTVADVMTDFDIRNIGVNVQANTLVIGLVDRTMEGAVVEFLQTKFDGFDTDCIMFGNAVQYELTASNAANNALAGSALSIGNPTPTLGFNAIRNGKYGVVTAGHIATVGTTIKNAVGTTIGNASAGDSLFDGIDAAFVEFENQAYMQASYQLMGTRPDGDILTNYYPTDYYLPGLDTYKIGTNTGFTTGKVLGVDEIHYVGTTKFTKQIHLSNLQRNGDSGGPVYCAFGKVQANLVAPKTIVGIATIQITSDETAIVSPVWEIKKAFGIEPYLYPLQYSYALDATKTVYSPGTVGVSSNILGSFPDGKCTQIASGSTKGSGGNIECTLNKASSGTVSIFARSEGTTTQIHVYVTNNALGIGGWDEITTSAKFVSPSSDMTWINCGSSSNTFRYVAIAAIREDNGVAANIYIDTVIVS